MTTSNAPTPMRWIALSIRANFLAGPAIHVGEETPVASAEKEVGCDGGEHT